MAGIHKLPSERSAHWTRGLEVCEALTEETKSRYQGTWCGAFYAVKTRQDAVRPFTAATRSQYAQAAHVRKSHTAPQIIVGGNKPFSDKNPLSTKADRIRAIPQEKSDPTSRTGRLHGGEPILRSEPTTWKIQPLWRRTFLLDMSKVS